MLLNCDVEEASWESLGQQGDPSSQSKRKSVLNIHWKDWCWSWNFNTLATWYEELTHLKRPWCWERLKTGGEGDDRGWEVWMASLTGWRWTSSGSWWWTGKPGVLQSMGPQRVGHDWATELNWMAVMMLFRVTSQTHASSSAQFSPMLWGCGFPLLLPFWGFSLQCGFLLPTCRMPLRNPCAPSLCMACYWALSLSMLWISLCSVCSHFSCLK